MLTNIISEGIPPDGTPIEIVNGLHPAIISIISILITGAGVFTGICFFFNVFFRNKK